MRVRGVGEVKIMVIALGALCGFLLWGCGATGEASSLDIDATPGRPFRTEREAAAFEALSELRKRAAFDVDACVEAGAMHGRVGSGRVDVAIENLLSQRSLVCRPNIFEVLRRLVLSGDLSPDLCEIPTYRERLDSPEWIELVLKSAKPETVSACFCKGWDPPRVPPKPTCDVVATYVKSSNRLSDAAMHCTPHRDMPLAAILGGFLLDCHESGVATDMAALERATGVLRNWLSIPIENPSTGRVHVEARLSALEHSLGNRPTDQ